MIGVGRLAPSVVPEQTMEGTPQVRLDFAQPSTAAFPNGSAAFCSAHFTRRGQCGVLPYRSSVALFAAKYSVVSGNSLRLGIDIPFLGLLC